MWHLQYVLPFPHRAGDQALADLRVQVYYSVFDLDERYWVYNYNLFYRSVPLSYNQCHCGLLRGASFGHYSKHAELMVLNLGAPAASTGAPTRSCRWRLMARMWTAATSCAQPASTKVRRLAPALAVLRLRHTACI